jgi:hypothetical protein
MTLDSSVLESFGLPAPMSKSTLGQGSAMIIRHGLVLSHAYTEAYVVKLFNDRHKCWSTLPNEGINRRGGLLSLRRRKIINTPIAEKHVHVF